MPAHARERSAQVRRDKAVMRARVAHDQVDGWQRRGPTALAQRLNDLGIPIASGQGEWTHDKACVAIELARNAQRGL